MSNTDDIIHRNTKNHMESKGHIKSRSYGTQYEHRSYGIQHDYRGDSIDSYNPQRRLDSDLSFPNSSSHVSHNSSPKRNVFHLSPKKTSKSKLYLKSDQPFINSAYTCKKRSAGVLPYKQSDVNNRSTGICNSKREDCYNYCSSYCSEGEKVGAVISEGMMEVELGGGVECSMCGDVGIAELLFLCSKCSLRPQHTYCGRSYPNVCGEASICNWCLHEQDSSTSTAAKGSNVLHNTSACETNDTNARSTVNVTHLVKELQCPAAPACVNEGYTDEDALVEIMGPHGKAFDYLLLVAAQSGLPQGISEASDEIKQTNQTASMIKITGSKIMTSSHKKANLDSDKKAKMGFRESNGSVANQARISNDRERSMEGLVKKLNKAMVQSAVNIKMDQSRSDHGGGVYAGENMPKRQRCSNGAEVPALKCRKRGLQLSPARPNYRRYKLLADVVC